MNWERRTKEDFGWKHGRIASDDESFQESILSDSDQGLKPDSSSTCPVCFAKMQPSLLLAHFEKHKVERAENPFSFFCGLGVAKKRPFRNHQISALEKAIADYSDNKLVKTVLVELAERSSNLEKLLAVRVLSQYLRLIRFPYSVGFDGKIFFVNNLKQPERIFSSEAFAEILEWFKQAWEPPKVSKQMEKLQTPEELLFGYQGRRSYDGQNICIDLNPVGSYSLALKSARLKHVLCSSARLDVAIAIAEFFADLSDRPAMREDEIRSELVKYNSKSFLGRTIRIFEHKSGDFDVCLISHGFSETVCKNAVPIVALVVLEFLVLGNGVQKARR